MVRPIPKKQKRGSTSKSNQTPNSQRKGRFKFQHLLPELRSIIYEIWIADAFPFKPHGYTHFEPIWRTICQLKWLQTCRTMRLEGKARALSRVIWYALTTGDLLMIRDRILGEDLFKNLRYICLDPKMFLRTGRLASNLLGSMTSLSQVEFTYYEGFEDVAGEVERMAKACDTIRVVDIVSKRRHWRCNGCFYRAVCGDIPERTVHACPHCGADLETEGQYTLNRESIEACQERINELLAERV